METKWKKAYRGPFKKLEATMLAQELKDIASPQVNGIYDAKIRKVKLSNQYDVYIQVLQEKAEKTATE